MTEPTIGEEGIEAAANALLHGEVWGPQNGPLDEESSEALDRLARAAITAYLATQRAPDEEVGRLRAALEQIAAGPSMGCGTTFLAWNARSIALAALTPSDDGTGQ